MAVVIPAWVVEAAKWFTLVVSSLGIPTALVSLYIRRAEKRHDEERAEKKANEERKEKERKEFELFQIQITAAAVALSEATARAVQRIPDAQCNGDMTKALEYAEKMKNQQKDFLAKIGVEHLYEQ